MITTDGLRSYRAAMTELGIAEKLEVGRWANNRVENSHLPFRRRERAMVKSRQMTILTADTPTVLSACRELPPLDQPTIDEVAGQVVAGHALGAMSI
jgi:transposase-like protein